MDNDGELFDIDTVESGFTGLVEGDHARFRQYAEQVESYQRQKNPIYRRFDGFRYLPVAAFKLGEVATFDTQEAEAVFRSSGTGSKTNRSSHFVRRLDVYRRSIETGFERVFGNGPFTLLAHLPHYETVGDRSSLVFMAQHLMDSFGSEESGFFLHDLDAPISAIERSQRRQLPIVLLGAAFGLLDLVDIGALNLPEDSIVIETGGMKTFRRELDRTSLHRLLADGFGLPRKQIRSEYGMCEMLSQCYTTGDEVYYPPPWMRFEVLDPEGSGRILGEGETGILAVFDLANMYSVSAILTEDLAVQRGHGFEVLGRMGQADLRGCNFLLEV